jgi:hypothetical protein
MADPSAPRWLQRAKESLEGAMEERVEHSWARPSEGIDDVLGGMGTGDVGGGWGMGGAQGGVDGGQKFARNFAGG